MKLQQHNDLGHISICWSILLLPITKILVDPAVALLICLRVHYPKGV